MPSLIIVSVLALKMKRLSTNIDGLEAELKETEKGINNLIKAIEKGVLSDTVTAYSNILTSMSMQTLMIQKQETLYWNILLIRFMFMMTGL